jgi:hypothetical protein
MAVKERELHQATPRHRRSEPEVRDSVAVVAVVVASIAMVARRRPGGHRRDGLLVRPLTAGTATGGRRRPPGDQRPWSW